MVKKTRCKLAEMSADVGNVFVSIIQGERTVIKRSAYAEACGELGSGDSSLIKF